VSDLAKAFITRLMNRNAKKRYTAEEALKDEWILKADSNVLDKPLAKKALKNLTTFRADLKLQSATWVFLVSLLANKKDKANLLKTFKQLDLNGDGLLSKDELVKGYNNVFMSQMTDGEVEKIFDRIDVNKNGSIDYSEFIAASLDRDKMLSKDRLSKVFNIFDKVSTSSPPCLPLFMPS